MEPSYSNPYNRNPETLIGTLSRHLWGSFFFGGGGGGAGAADRAGGDRLDRPRRLGSLRAFGRLCSGLGLQGLK